MTEKMTHSSALTMAIALLSSDTTDHSEIIEHLTAVRDSIDKRAEKAKNTERKPSPKQIAEAQARVEEANKVLVKFEQEPNRLFGCKELADMFEVSVPKMSRLLGILIEGKQVTRLDGKKPSFQLAKGE